VAKAKLAGCTALVVTVDMPVPGTDTVTLVRACLDRSPRPAVSSGLRPPGLDLGCRYSWTTHTLGNVASALGSDSGLEDFMGWLTANFDPTVDWRDLENVRELWDGPLIIKGILDPRMQRRLSQLAPTESSCHHEGVPT